MGTRGIMGVRIDGQDKIAYNHFDSYPTGIGVGIVRAISESEIGTLADRARALRVIDGETPPTADEIERLRRYADTRVSNQTLSDWYCLLRETHGDLAATLDAGVMVDAADFTQDSLFCEWGYIVNFDDGLFEVYRGFQDKPHSSGRFASENSNRGYFPIALVASFPIGSIPKDWTEVVDPQEED